MGCYMIGILVINVSLGMILGYFTATSIVPTPLIAKRLVAMEKLIYYYLP